MRFPRCQPALQIFEPADIGQMRCVVFECQQPFLADELTLRGDDFRHVIGSDRAVVADCVAYQSPRVGIRQASQGRHERRYRSSVDAQVFADIFCRPNCRLFRDDPPNLVRPWQVQGKARGKTREFARECDIVTDKHEPLSVHVVRLGNFLDQANMDRIVQKRMEIEQQVDTRFFRITDYS